MAGRRPESPSQDRRDQIDPQIGGPPRERGRAELAGGVDGPSAARTEESDHQPDGQSDGVRQQACTAGMSQEQPDDEHQDDHAARLGEKDGRGSPGGGGSDRGVVDR
ncbi:hypothetical protein GCM10027176_50560 [Actinoallomurus bryophytorum]